MSKSKIHITDGGFRIDIEATTPMNTRKGHRPHKSGAGFHEDKRKKNVRIRGNNAKRAWLDN